QTQAIALNNGPVLPLEGAKKNVTLSPPVKDGPADPNPGTNKSGGLVLGGGGVVHRASASFAPLTGPKLVPSLQAQTFRQSLSLAPPYAGIPRRRLESYSPSSSPIPPYPTPP